MSDSPSRPTLPVATQDLKAARADATAVITESPYRGQDPTGLLATGDSVFNAATYPDQETVHGPAIAQGAELNSVSTTAATGACVSEDSAGLAATQPIEATGDFALAEQTGISPRDQVGDTGALEPTIGSARRRDAASEPGPVEPGRVLLWSLPSEAISRQGRHG